MHVFFAFALGVVVRAVENNPLGYLRLEWRKLDNGSVSSIIFIAYASVVSQHISSVQVRAQIGDQWDDVHYMFVS